MTIGLEQPTKALWGCVYTLNLSIANSSEIEIKAPPGALLYPCLTVDEKTLIIDIKIALLGLRQFLESLSYLLIDISM